MKPLEKSIEGRVVSYAKKKYFGRIDIVKLNGPGKRSHPDRMFLGPHGRVVFIEFKREGKKPTPLQHHLHKQWNALGHRVHVVDNPDHGKRLVDGMYRADLLYPLEDR